MNIVKRSICLLGAILLAVAGCSNTDETVETFSYADLETIPLTVELEIGESENYIPAQISGIVVYPDGSILINEAQRTEIIQFSSGGDFIGPIANAGEGPGEIMGNFYELIPIGEDSLLVNYRQGGRRDYFGRNSDGKFEFAHSIFNEQSNQSLTLVGAMSVDTYFAIRSQVNAMSLIENYEPYREVDLIVADSENSVVMDNGIQLKQANQYIAVTNGANGAITSISVNAPFPYRYQDHFSAIDENGSRFLIASADSSAFYVYELTANDAEAVESGYNLSRKISWNATERPMTEEDLDLHMEEMSQDYRETAEEYTEENKPPFLDVWTGGDNILLHTDTTVEGKEMVLLTMEGQPLGKFLLPTETEVESMINGQLYTIHRDNASGHSVRVYSLDI